MTAVSPHGAGKWNPPTGRNRPEQLSARFQPRPQPDLKPAWICQPRPCRRLRCAVSYSLPCCRASLEQDLRLEPYLLVVGSVRATGGGNRLLFVDIGIVGLKLQVVLVDVPRNRTGALYPMVAGDIPVRVDVGITGGQLELFRDHEIAGLG